MSRQRSFWVCYNVGESDIVVYGTVRPGDRGRGPRREPPEVIFDRVQEDREGGATVSYDEWLAAQSPDPKTRDRIESDLTQKALEEIADDDRESWEEYLAARGDYEREQRKDPLYWEGGM